MAKALRTGAQPDFSVNQGYSPVAKDHHQGVLLYYTKLLWKTLTLHTMQKFNAKAFIWNIILDVLSQQIYIYITVSSLGNFLEVGDSISKKYCEKTWRVQISLFIILFYNMQTQQLHCDQLRCKLLDKIGISYSQVLQF